MTIIEAIILGLIEGLTEFLPVSSTGHILLAGHFLGIESTGKSFEILIQLGAILAILAVYFSKFWEVAKALPTDPGAQRFVIGVLLAFIPAAILGVSFHSVIKTIFFESPRLICIMLVIGGILLLIVERIAPPANREDATQLPLATAFQIGLFQCLALIPGVSRSGATIAGALMLGVSKRAAAEFSFFLALPTMAGAFTYDLYKNYNHFSPEDAKLIVIGFIVALITAVIIVRAVLDFIGHYGFAPFAYWRIVVGSLGLALLWTN